MGSPVASANWQFEVLALHNNPRISLNVAIHNALSCFGPSSSVALATRLHI